MTLVILDLCLWGFVNLIIFQQNVLGDDNEMFISSLN